MILPEQLKTFSSFPNGRVDVVTPNDFFWKIVNACMKITSIDGAQLFPKPLLALDPGETTGVAWLKNGKIYLSQWDTKDIGLSFEGLSIFLSDLIPAHVRYEDYKVYAWKASDHSFASLHTPQWIGAIKVACRLANVTASTKMAQMAKAFWTDDKLKACGLYSPGLNHARDASRHLLYYMCFGMKEAEQVTP